MTASWYAMRSKPNKEGLLCSQLDLHKIHFYYPQIKVHPVNPRSRKVRSYFPGYLFTRIDFSQTALSELLWLPASSGLVSFGGEPATIPENLIHAIRNHVEELNLTGIDLIEQFKMGDRVVIQEGPLAGYTGIFDSRISGSDRVRILLQLLRNKQMQVVLPVEYVKQKKR
jgi:transcription antitermination factor NusG